MNIDFTSLQTETVQYFVLNSGAFVAGLGLLFFLLGLTFGGLTWRRYRHRWLGAVEDEKKLRSELADLQKQLADRESSKAPEPSLPKESARAVEPSPVPDKPALTEMPDLLLPKVMPPLAAATLAPEALPKFEFPSLPDLPALYPAKPALSEPLKNPEPPAIAVEVAQPEPSAKPESLEEKQEDKPAEDPEIQPFSFLLSDDADEPAAAPPEETQIEDEAGFMGFILDEEESSQPEPEEKAEESDRRESLL